MTYDTLLTAVHGDGPVRAALITLNRPQALNALNDTLMDELGAALRAFDADPAIGAIVITGSDKAFAAGADIGVLAQHDFVSAYTTDLIGRNWETIRSIRKPVIAAVAGFALGGGCELAMMCDIVIAAVSARFGAHLDVLISHGQSPYCYAQTITRPVRSPTGCFANGRVPPRRPP